MMRLLFIYGPVASGKLTIARLVAERSSLPLFHNHLIVDAVAAVFPFGSKEFVQLRERFWVENDFDRREGRAIPYFHFCSGANRR